MPQYHYSESTAQQIANYIRKNPGHTGREIASALGLRREHVNSWLYTPWVQQRYRVKVRNYRWYSWGVEPSKTSYKPSRPAPQFKTLSQSQPLPTASQYKEVESQKRKTASEWKEHLRTYTTEQIQKTFDNPRYDSMPDEFKVALGEVLQEREKVEKAVNPQPLVDVWKQEIKKYPSEAVDKAFASSNYDKLADEQKAALAEVLEEQKQTQVTTAHSGGSRLAKRVAMWTIISAGVLLVGFLLLYHLLLTGTSNRTPVPSPGNPPRQIER